MFMRGFVLPQPNNGLEVVHPRRDRWFAIASRARGV